ncbi:MAG: LPXTG cell wall anchor domain-containing protein [Lachnospiraceae bacterium]|nr:LPXTG cell wall anchor domain-containing protein [Lachnospiraceae bacterium]
MARSSKKCLLFAIIFSFSISLNAMAGNIGFTQEDMRNRFKEFEQVLSANWEEWSTPPDTYTYGHQGWLPGLRGFAGTIENVCSFTNEQYLELDEMSVDYFNMNFFLNAIDLVNPSSTSTISWYGKYQNVDNFLASVESIYLKGIYGLGLNPHVETLRELIGSYAEYVAAFYEATGLVYSPLEDIFYAQLGVPYSDGEAMPDAQTADAGSNNNAGSSDVIDIFEGLSGDEREELENFINESIAELESPPLGAAPSSGAGGKGNNFLLIGGIIVLAAIAIIIILRKKRQKFLSDPE